MTEVKNSGYCGASWAFSTVAFFEQQNIIAGNANSSLDLSEMYLIGCNPENQRCAAGYIESSIDLVIDKGGIPLEVKYPYNLLVLVQTNGCIENDFFKITNKIRMSYYKIYNPESIKKLIFKKPVIAAICGADLVSYSPKSASNSSRTLKCKPQNRIIDHSVLLVGYTETEWIVKNHWGKNWGLDGYAYISRNPAEDCCIGEQLHSSGIITDNCSVQYCQTCVETDSCYRCTSGRWVKHNLTTGVQTCELCTEANCIECYNYIGTCKWCADGYAMNVTTGKCVPTAILFCNSVSSSLCNQCKTGYKLSSTRSYCSPFCLVKNCNKCINGPCTECKPGFSLTNINFNGSSIQYCAINSCTVGNCTYCNSTGSCITCASSFTLQANGSCTTNCTAIASCVSCLAGSTTCNECIEGKSYNSTKKACEVFSGTTNCKIHKTTCTTCRTGYTLTSGQCIQTCESSYCLTCVPSDITYCLTCVSGYFLNRTTVYSVCSPYPCNVSGCALCNSVGSCISCTSKFYVFNATSNRCENQCSMQNCRDCLPAATACSYCNPGYAIDYTTKVCVPYNVSNCLYVAKTNGTQYCYQCETKYYPVSSPDRCLIWCTDQYCQQCQYDTLYICQKCFDGYYMKLINGILTCTLIPSSMPGCQKISFNQSYCFSCNMYYLRNQKTGVCQKNTQNCPAMCDYCTTNMTRYFGCKCHQGFILDLDTQKCTTNPLNDSKCLMAQFQYTAYFCLECPMGSILNAAWTGCDPSCLVSGCSSCSSTDNLFCIECSSTFYLSSDGTSCIKCPFANCTRCKSNKCLDCDAGFQLAPNSLSCNPIVCKPGYLFDGYECICPRGTYQTVGKCEVCSILNCLDCNSIQCFACQNSYFLQNNTCKKCQTNCRLCNSSAQCLECSDGFYISDSQCIQLNNQVGVYSTNGSSVVQCPANCLQCDTLGSCLKCTAGTVNVLGVCANCQGYCKSCLLRNTSFCTSCYDGFYFNQTNCLKCNQSNCLECSVSPLICSNCREGFYLVNNSCQSCTGQNCLACNLNGQCTKCSSGFVLLGDFSCEQCGGNCRECNSSAINQCFAVCNLTSYKLDGQCYSCTNPCKTCSSASFCLSCIEGFQLRNNSCLPFCSQGCFQCNPSNISMCTVCLTGYSLTENGTCLPDLSCNTNQSCTVCPKKWTLLNNTCQSCVLSSNCTQCAVGNVTLCTECDNAFFLNISICIPCASNCLKCLSLEQCLSCENGFFIPKGQLPAICTSCDPNCKTCSEFSTRCIDCNEGFELSVEEKCLRIQKINGTLELNIEFNSFPTVSRLIKNDVISLLGSDYQNESRLYIITDLRQGSTLLSFYLAIPEDKDPQSTYDSFRDQISNRSSIGGVEIISVQKLELLDPTRPPEPQTNPTNSTNTTNLTVPLNGSQINKVKIILGVVIPSSLIILAIIALIIRKRLQKANLVENVPTEIFNQSKEDIKIHTKTKLPPIAHYNSNLSPVKDSEADRFNSTGKNQTFFTAPQQRSYEHFLEKDEDNKAQIVNELDLNIDSHIRRNLDIHSISSIERLEPQNTLLDEEINKNPIKKFISSKDDPKNNEVDDIEFVDDTLRQLKQKPPTQILPISQQPKRDTQQNTLQIQQIEDIQQN